MKTWMIFLLLMLVTSCTVTKRQFRPGWHVEWRKPVPTAVQPETETSQAVELSDQSFIDDQPELPTELIRTENNAIEQPIEQPELTLQQQAISDNHDQLTNSAEQLSTHPESTSEAVVQPDEPEDPKKARRQERRENFWEIVGSILLIMLVIVLIAGVLIALYAAANVSVGLFLLVLIPVILLIIVITLLISTIHFMWVIGFGIGKILRKGAHP